MADCSYTTSAITGVAGKAVVDDTLVARITQWSLEPTAGDSEWGDSDGEGYTLVKSGRKGATGSCEGKIDTSTPQYAVFDIGDEVELVLWLDASRYYVIPCAVITSFSLTVNVDSQEVVGWTSNFKTSGKFYYPGQSGAPSQSLPS